LRPATTQCIVQYGLRDKFLEFLKPVGHAEGVVTMGELCAVMRGKGGWYIVGLHNLEVQGESLGIFPM